MKILHILETAFRGTVEEQDDTVVWTVHAMKNAGQQGTVLLRGNIVAHAARNQRVAPLFGQSNPVDLAGDLEKLVASGIPVLVVREDAADRGLGPSDLIDAVEGIDRSQVAALCDEHEAVWHW